MIDIRKLKELVRLMVGNDLTELDLRDSEEQVTLRRHGVHQPPQVIAAPGGRAAGAESGPAQPAAAPAAAAGAEVAAGTDENLLKIESPMVGTFYTAANPEAPPFVRVGAQVEPDTVVCLIEAMKIFNEIKAECTGTIEKILVESAESVEFGQAMFLVKPN